MSSLEIFNPVREKLTGLVEENKGIVINGLDDNDNYAKMKEARKIVRKGEIELEDLRKDETKNALAYQKGLIQLEKDLKKDITTPLLEEYDKQLLAFEEGNAKKERMSMLPDKKIKLKEIELEMSDDKILEMDEKTWVEFYQEKKMAYLETKDQERKAKEKKEQDDKVRARTARLAEIGLVFNGQEFIYADVNVHHTELLLEDDKFEELFTKIKPVVEDRKKVAEQKIKDEAKAEAKEEAKTEIKETPEPKAEDKPVAEVNQELKSPEQRLAIDIIKELESNISEDDCQAGLVLAITLIKKVVAESGINF